MNNTVNIFMAVAASVFVFSCILLQGGFREYSPSTLDGHAIVVLPAGSDLTDLQGVTQYAASFKRAQQCYKKLPVSNEWLPPNTPSAIQDLPQHNPHLVQHICENWILPPFAVPTRLKEPNRIHYSQTHQSEIVDELLHQKENGFFIECGAFDGENLSNSLFFEKSRNWTGILIEANPVNFQALLSRKRHSYMVNACLSPITKPVVLTMKIAGVLGGLETYMDSGHQNMLEATYSGKNITTTSVQCFPLASILRAIGITHVDYFSLDIEGAEVDVLKTLPLDQITVDVFSIEFKVHKNATASTQKLQIIKDLLVDQYGYTVARQFRAEQDVYLMRNMTDPILDIDYN